MQNLRGWLLERTDAELEELKDTSRFSTPTNRRELNTVIYERKYGALPDSWEEDAAPLNNKYRSDAIQAAARALLQETHWQLGARVDFDALVPILCARQACHADTAKRHLAKAARVLRGEDSAAQWGGPRPGAGRPKEA